MGCVCRNLADMVAYKIVATLVSRYGTQFVDPRRESEVAGSWFPRRKGLVCFLWKTF